MVDPMCGRFAMTADDAVTIAEDLAQEFGIVLAPAARDELKAVHRPRYNVTPGQRHWLIDTRGSIRVGTWGFRREGHKEVFFNARAETVHQKPTFAQAFERSRALVVGDAFYEWNTLGSREPWLFRPRGLRLFAFAAIIDEHAQGEFSLLTTAPNELIETMHPRMPALLGRGASREWLDPDTGVQRASSLLHPAPASAMSMEPVGAHVNNPSHDDPRCFEAPRQTSLF